MSDQRVSLENVAQPQAGEAGYTPPSEIVPLPSGGRIYPAESPLFDAKTIEIRSMTARDEDILTSRALLKQGKAISTLLRSCIVNRAIDPETMVVGDRNAALIAIRVTGYGSEYEALVECPECESSCKHGFDLSKLQVKPLSAEPIAVGRNEFAFRLAKSKRDVVFKLLTGADETELTANMERTRKAVGAGGVENVVTQRLLASIVSLGGETDRSKLEKFIRTMPAADSRALRVHIEKISPGVEMKQLFVCPACSASAEVDVPLGTEFFWPS